jgi:hypothetical protein
LAWCDEVKAAANASSLGEASRVNRANPEPGHSVAGEGFGPSARLRPDGDELTNQEGR